MENEYVVNGEDLVSVADAIREKSGTTEGLTFPDGFVETVGAIDTGKDGIKFDHGHYFGTGEYRLSRGSQILQYPEGANVLSFDFVPMQVDVWRYKKCTFKFFDLLYDMGGLGRMTAPSVDGRISTGEYRNAAATMDERQLKNLADAKVYWGFDNSFHYIAATIEVKYHPGKTVNGNAPWMALYFDHNGDGICKTSNGYPGNWNCTQDSTCVALMMLNNSGLSTLHYLTDRTGSTASAAVKITGPTSQGTYMLEMEVRIPRGGFTSGLDAFVNNPANNGKGLPFQILTGFVNASGERETTDIPCEFILSTDAEPAKGQRAFGYGAVVIREGEVGRVALDNRLLYNPNTGKWDLLWALDEDPGVDQAQHQLNGADQGKTFRYVAWGVDAETLHEKNGW